ncbi:MAG: cell wall hydrolase [Lachnospiraceae bacterium]
MTGKKLRRRSFFMATVLLLCAMPYAPSSAKTTQEKLEEAQQQQQETQEQLAETKDNLSSLEGQRNELQEELSSLNDQLNEVSDNLEDLEAQIEDKEAEIAQTQADLEAARQQELEQYESMKERIRFMYENAEATYLELLFTARSFADFLNRSEYIAQIEEYDRQKLEEYQQTRAFIEEEEARLETELAELEELSLAAQAEQQRVNELVAETADSIAGYSDQISVTEAQMLAYEAQIEQQNSNIAALQAQLEEEKRLAALSAASVKRDISQVTFDEGDRYLLANLIYCEAGGEPYAGQLAVGAVVINRVLSPLFPDTVVGVIYAKRQFSPVASGRLALALAQNRATANCYRAADEAMSGVTNVSDCVFFRTPIDGINPRYVIGGHIFY